MTAYMYDAAYEPTFNTVRQRGGIAVNHYLTGTYASTSSDPVEARLGGLGVVLTYEQATDELLHLSSSTARELGWRIVAAVPHGCPIDGTVAVYVSVDVAVADGQLPAVVQSFRWIREALGGRLSLRCYGQGSLIDALEAANVTDGPGWLAAASAWPGFDPASANVCLIQMHDRQGRYIGTDIPSTDRNLIVDPFTIGAWWPDDSPWSDAMPTADEIATAVWSHPLAQVAADDKTATSLRHPAHSWLTHGAAYAQAASRLNPAVSVDAKAVADAVVAELGPELAQAVAAELAARLAS